MHLLTCRLNCSFLFQVTPSNVDIAKVSPTYHLYTPAEVEAVISRLWGGFFRKSSGLLLCFLSLACICTLWMVRENLRFSATFEAIGDVFTDSLQIKYGTFLMGYCKLRWTIWLVLLRKPWSLYSETPFCFKTWEYLVANRKYSS